MKISTIIILFLSFTQLVNGQEIVQGTITKNLPHLDDDFTISAMPNLDVNGGNFSSLITISIEAESGATDNTNAPAATAIGIAFPSNTIAAQPVYLEAGRYIYEFSITSTATVAWTSGMEYPLMEVDFPSGSSLNVTNNFPRLEHKELSSSTFSSYWYIEVGGNDFTNYSSPGPFYSNTGGQVSNVPFDDSFVGADQPLPITLESFAASKFNNTASQLNWVSSSEVNASHIEVERSSDGISWDKLGTVEAKGGYNIRSTYNYLDEALPLSRGNQNIFYYRLNLVDLDGASEYSEIRSVTFEQGHITALDVYPNPAVDQIFVEMSSTNLESAQTKLYVFDVTGKMVLKQSISTNGISPVNISNLARSIYTLKVNYDGQEINKKIVKVD